MVPPHTGNALFCLSVSLSFSPSPHPSLSWPSQLAPGLLAGYRALSAGSRALPACSRALLPCSETLSVVFGSRSGKGVIWALSRIASFSDTSKPRICFNLIVCLYVMFNIHHVMFSDDQGIDHMINRPENLAEMRLY